MLPEIGVLALQGDFAEHAAMLDNVGVRPREVRLPGQLEGLAGLIIPGGESTTMGRLMVSYELLDPIRSMGANGLPLWGTCAGLILMATDVGSKQPLLGLMHMRVERNAFGRQIDSFETHLCVDGCRGGPLPAIFIRAPIVHEVGIGVEVLARLEDGSIVAARQGKILVTAFHPELTNDTRMHEFFCAMAVPG